MSELQVENLTAAYERADVLSGVSVTAHSGQITCILGANGAGKTTLIRSLLGLTRPREGSIRFAGQELVGRPTHEVVSLGTRRPEGV